MKFKILDSVLCCQSNQSIDQIYTIIGTFQARKKEVMGWQPRALDGRTMVVHDCLSAARPHCIVHAYN